MKLEKTAYKLKYKTAYYYFRDDDIPKCITTKVPFLKWLFHYKAYEKSAENSAMWWYAELLRERTT